MATPKFRENTWVLLHSEVKRNLPKLALVVKVLPDDTVCGDPSCCTPYHEYIVQYTSGARGLVGEWWLTLAPFEE